MANVDLKQLLIRQINQLDPNIDTSVGSNVRDLLINPLTTLLRGYQNDHQRLLDNLSIADVRQLTEEELDAVAANYLVSRKEGSFHTGTIKLFFSSPVPLSLSPNTRVIDEATGLEYEVSNGYSITKSAMQLNVESNGYYSTGEINVRSVLRTNRGALQPGSVLKSRSITSPQPARIEVATAINGGTLREDNNSFYQRILNSVKTSTLASSEVIKQEVLSESNAIEFVDVIGAGSPLMRRDLVGYNLLQENTVEDFQYVQSGQGADSKFKEHVAYIDNFRFTVASGQAANVVWPTTPAEWVTEFSNEQYRGLFELADGLTATQDQYQIVSVTNWGNAFRDWEKNDGSKADNLLIFEDEIRLSGNDVTLGKTPDPNSEAPEARFFIGELEIIEQSLQDAIAAGDVGALGSLITTIQEKKDPESYANLAPIIHKAINQHIGIDIDVTMSTTDGTELGEMCYITVLRNDTIYMAFDGYGLAWRKQPEFLLRLNEDSYGGDTDLRNADIAKFEDYFGVNPVNEGLVGSQTLQNGSGNDQYWFYNMYIVDNNALDEEVIIGTNRVFDSTNGINQYLARAKYWIEPEVDYDFKIEITEALGTTISVKESSGGSFDQVLTKGATFPNYVPVAGDTINTGQSSVDTLNSTRGHFGIGVVQTKGYEWTVKDTFVRSNIQTFPQHLFQFKLDFDKWDSTTDNFQVDYYGVGYDPLQYAADSNTGNSRTQAAIWNATSEEWELIGTHTAEISDSASAKLLSKEFTNLSTYADADDYIYVAASAANFGTGFEDNVDHNLITYYVQLSNPDANKINLGNAIDVYCHAPTQIVEQASSFTVSNNEVNITEGYIADIVEVRDTLSNVAIPEADFQVYNISAGESLGADNSYRIAFDASENYNGSQVTVIYRTWAQASSINAFLNAPENRYPAVSLKEKVSPITVITINSLEYRGDIDVEVARQAIVDYINTIEDGQLEKSDLIQVLNNLGATFVSTDMDIDIKQHDTILNVNETSLTGDTYNIPTNTIGYFYTNNILAGGVTKL